MDIRLKELLHNLKDRNWDVNPTYKIDENEARKIIQALDETDKKIADYTYMIGLLQDRIEGIEAVNKWIPVSERLPEKHGDYLVTIENGDVFNCYFNPDYCYDGYDNGAFTYTQEYFDRETMGSLGTEEFAFDDVIAWMPLPQVYKGVEE